MLLLHSWISWIVFSKAYFDKFLWYTLRMKRSLSIIWGQYYNLREHQLYSKWKKYEIWLTEMTLLRYVVSKERIKVNPMKIKVVTKWPKPTNVIEVRSFLGLAGYYWRFTKDFSKIASPLTNLLKKITKFEWSHKCKEAFQELKRCLTIVLILTLLVEEK